MNNPFLKKTLPALIGLALSSAAGQAMALAIIGNNIYEVHISDSGSIGSWNAVTAAGNPTGAGNDLLYDGTTTGTNNSSLIIYSPTGGTTIYTFDGTSGSTIFGAPNSSGASAFGTAANSYSQTWNNVSGLAVTQDLIVTGTTYANSAIYHTVTFTNTTNSTIDFGWRNLYDWAVNDPGFDDGPSNAIEVNGVGVVIPTTTYEFSYAPVVGSYARVAAAPPPSGGATYEPLLGLGFDPGFIAALPVTMPELYDYVSWPNSIGTAFGYTTNGLYNVTGDSAGLSYFGATANTALGVAAGQTIRLTQTIYAVPPGGSIPGGGGGTVPEPATLALLSLGLAGMGMMRRRKV